ncbi:hypothetical protein [Oceanobacillus alkalisoli]|nr:hypothetical protein [Oceanobacillus alkalisoli]
MINIFLYKKEIKLKQIHTTPEKTIKETKFIIPGGAGDGII